MSIFLSLPVIPEDRKSSARSTNSMRSWSFGPKNHLQHSMSNTSQQLAAKLSKNLFSTVLREETEEVVENEMTPKSSSVNTPLFGSLKKFPKTLPELGRQSSIVRSEVVEENQLRKARVEKCFQELQNIKSEQHTVFDGTTLDHKMRRSVVDTKDKVYKIAEDVLGMYNIKLKLMDHTTEDSAMRVEKLVDRSNLTEILEILIKEIAKFPYSFFRKINMFMFTFCQDIANYKEEKNPVVKKKVLSGLFAVNRLRNEQDVINHFYNIVFYHMKSLATELDDHWSKVYVRKSKTIMHISMNVIVTESTRAKKNFFDEQANYFKQLVINPNKALKNEQNVIRIKAFKLKDCMEKIDPDGINEAWWKSRGFTLMIGSLDHLN